MRLAWLGLGITCLFGCSDASTTQKSIGAAGGELRASDGTAVSIPAGALASDTIITVHAVSDASPPGGQVVGTTYQFGPEGTQFEVPVTVTLAYAPDKLPPGRTPAEIAIFTAAAGSTTYQQLSTQIVDSTHVSASTSHFSIFVAALTTGDSSTDATPLGDLAAPLVDAGADGACTVSFSGGTSTTTSCSLSANCGGHTYQMTCGIGDQGTEVCICSMDGSVTSSMAGGVCSSLSARDTAWTSGCGFPGTEPPAT